MECIACLKKASIDVCSRKKVKTTFKIGSAAAASMITKPHWSLNNKQSNYWGNFYHVKDKEH